MNFIIYYSTESGRVGSHKFQAADEQAAKAYAEAFKSGKCAKKGWEVMTLERAA